MRGQGRFVDDIAFPGEVHGVLVMSPHAHARIVAIDIADAVGSPGVLHVFTGAEARQAGFGGIPAFVYPEDMGGPPSYHTQWPMLVDDEVRCVGDRVAFVVAETAAQAADAAALVRVDYQPLEAVVDVRRAPSGPSVWPDCANNVCFEMKMGDEAAAAAAFGGAAHVVEVGVCNQRLSANPIEPRAAIGLFDEADGRYTLYTTSQNPHGVRNMVARSVLRIEEASVRVISPDVGGGFGMKANAYPEDALVLWAARRCGRPVRWTCSRSGALASDNHGRDQVATGHLALDEHGTILALRFQIAQALGAYFVSASAAPARTALQMAPSVYRIPALWGEARALFTHTAPIGVYRGAGRPEANMLIERLLDRAAADCGFDPVDLRRRNLVGAEDMPFKTATGSTYDTGDFPAIFRDCLERSDWDGFEDRRRSAAARGRLLGRSICPYIEYGGIGNERMELKIDAAGQALIVSGTHAHGQGHATSYAQIVGDRLGLPLASIRFVQGDTDRVTFGRGTYAARSSLVGGCALALATDGVLVKATRMAAVLLQAPADAVTFGNALFSLTGTNRSVSWQEVARACHGFMLPAGMDLGLEAAGVWGAFPPNYPNGCHVCEIEVDAETGATAITKYVVVDDVGTIINPMICEGQIHGGLAQGIGQALMEEVVYADDGQLVTGSFMDYAMPRAGDLPAFDVGFRCIPSSTNVLGIKAVGESSIVASPAAIVNALLDALRPLGVDDIATPATPARIVKAIRAAKERRAPLRH